MRNFLFFYLFTLSSVLSASKIEGEIQNGEFDKIFLRKCVAEDNLKQITDKKLFKLQAKKINILGAIFDAMTRKKKTYLGHLKMHLEMLSNLYIQKKESIKKRKEALHESNVAVAPPLTAPIIYSSPELQPLNQNFSYERNLYQSAVPQLPQEPVKYHEVKTRRNTKMEGEKSLKISPAQTQPVVFFKCKSLFNNQGSVHSTTIAFQLYLVEDSRSIAPAATQQHEGTTMSLYSQLLLKRKAGIHDNQEKIITELNAPQMAVEYMIRLGASNKEIMLALNISEGYYYSKLRSELILKKLGRMDTNALYTNGYMQYNRKKRLKNLLIKYQENQNAIQQDEPSSPSPKKARLI